jgi:rhamnosyltransferase subunit B
MARIVISTFGSTGDLNPLLALGLELRNHGHDVVFALQDSFAPVVEGQGFTVRHLSGNVVKALANSTTSLLGASNPIPSLRALMRYGIMPTLDSQIRELANACLDADLLITSYGQLAGSFVAEQRDIPWATVALSPVTVPSDYIVTQPQPFKLPAGLQLAANRVQRRIGSLILRQIADRPINRVRARYHLNPLHESLWLGAASRQLVCVACSPAFQPVPPDWPPFVRMTGFCFWDQPPSWEPPASLQAFLRDARPYVVVTAGSIAPELHEAFAGYFQTSMKAIGGLGLRALVIGRPPDSSLSSSEALALPFAPYSLVFPGAAAIVHHGGIGTTAEALRSGIPSLIVPWGVDQFYSASQIARIGAGSFLYWRRYTPDRAAASLADLVQNKRIRARTQELGSTILGEHGAANAYEAVLSLLR